MQKNFRLEKIHIEGVIIREHFVRNLMELNGIYVDLNRIYGIYAEFNGIYGEFNGIRVIFFKMRE